MRGGSLLLLHPHEDLYEEKQVRALGVERALCIPRFLFFFIFLFFFVALQPCVPNLNTKESLMKFINSEKKKNYFNALTPEK